MNPVESKSLLSKPMNIRVDDDLQHLLRDLSGQFGLSVSDIVRAAVKEKAADWARTGKLVLNASRP